MSRLPIALALAASLALPGAAAAQSAFDPAGMTPEQREAFRAEIRDYLLDNPEIIVEAIQVLEQRRQAETEASDQSRVAEHAQALFDDGFSYVAGNPEGDVTIVEFFDYRCGFCKRAHPVMEKLLEEDGNIRVVFKEFPILGPQSVMAGRMALAALDIAPENYMALHEALMTHRGELTEVAAYRMAKEAGYDIAELKARKDAPEIEARLAETYELAEALGLQGTPSFVIGDQIVRGFLDYDAMVETVAEARAGE